MSFKIFSLQLLGRILPVEKIESKRKLLFDDYKEYIQVENSTDLKLYYDLETRINSEEFKKKKIEIQALQFKSSKEYNLLQEYNSLKKKTSIKKYFKALNSAELKRYESVRDSAVLKDYEALVEYVKEGQFQKEKREIENLIYKGSVEEKHFNDYRKLEKTPAIKAWLKLHNSKQIENHIKAGESDKIKKYLDLKNTPSKEKQLQKKFKKLQKDKEIKHYFRFEDSRELKLYRETVDSLELKRYEDLKSYVGNTGYKRQVEYLKDKSKFEKSATYQKWRRYKELAGNADIKFFMKYEKSAIHKNYLDVKDSFDLKRFFELQEITSSREFHERKAYLEDKNKWQKTEEYISEQKYLELKSNPYLVKYFKYKGTNDFKFFREWEVNFEEEFSSAKLNPEKWSVMPSWSEKLLGRNYSLPGDMHAFTLGQNIKTGGSLTIETRKEKSEGIVWKMSAGFIPHDFEYTSGLISSSKSFNQPDEFFEAKIKFNPRKEVVSSFVLQGEHASPRIYLLEMGAKNRIGIAHNNTDGKLEMEGLDISNLKKNKWYILTLERLNGNFTWKINDTEVLRMEQNKVNFPLQISLMTLVLNQIPGSKLPVKFETQWIRCYQKRNQFKSAE